MSGFLVANILVQKLEVGTRDSINWVWTFYWVLELKIFPSAPNLRNSVPILNLLLAIDTRYTPCKFTFQKPKCWGHRGEKNNFGVFRRTERTILLVFHLGPQRFGFGNATVYGYSSSQ